MSVCALKRLRDYRKKIHHPQAKANRVANNTISQAMAKETSGVDTISVKHVSVKVMTMHDGNRHGAMNRSISAGMIGEILYKPSTKCAMKGARPVDLPYRGTLMQAYRFGVAC